MQLTIPQSSNTATNLLTEAVQATETEGYPICDALLRYASCLCAVDCWSACGFEVYPRPAVNSTGAHAAYWVKQQRHDQCRDWFGSQWTRRWSSSHYELLTWLKKVSPHDKQHVPSFQQSKNASIWSTGSSPLIQRALMMCIGLHDVFHSSFVTVA